MYIYICLQVFSYLPIYFPVSSYQSIFLLSNEFVD